MASCWKYRDTWRPFFELFRKFWPDCPYKVWLLTDDYIIGAPEDQAWIKQDVAVFIHPSTSWCEILKAFCEQYGDEPILLMQDDFLLTERVNTIKVEQALNLIVPDVVCMRLYPCPGPDDVPGKSPVGIISRGEMFRISCQAAIWNPDYLRQITEVNGSARDFEIKGSKLSNSLHGSIFGFSRELPHPWPLEYICTGIVKGKWTRAALALCKEHGIAVDTSLRPIEP